MHIEFAMPTQQGGVLATYNLPLLLLHLKQWSDIYGIEYDTELTRWALNVRLQQQQYYSWFVLTWAWSGLHHYRIYRGPEYSQELCKYSGKQD